MPQIIDSDKMVALNRIRYLVGSIDVIKGISNTPALPPFDDTVLSFLSDLSKEFINVREYSDVVTFGFWIRRASLNTLKERFSQNTEGYRGYRLGRGLVFHIAPSNVPVNFAYSLVSALLMGNSNIVRVPSKDFPQVKIITKAINTVIKAHPAMKKRIICVQYDHQDQQAAKTAKAINDLFSSICDVRIIWGGDMTIETLRQSSLQPRSTEITFADRFSIAVIDSDSYLAIEDKARTAQDFYNDTFFSDQNACTSPKIIFWVGTEEKIAEAKSLFWQLEHDFAKTKYNFQPIMGVNKLTRAYIDAAKGTDQEHISFKIEPREDNLIVRVAVQNTDMLSTFSTFSTLNTVNVFNTLNTFQNLDNNSGFFYECNLDREHFSEGIRAVCNDKRCQTVAYIGDKEMFTELLRSGIKGIDRIVPIGKTMDFDLIWDGYNLPEYLSRIISIL